MNVSKDIDMVMLMYSLIEFSDNIWKFMAIPWRYNSHNSDEINNDAIDFGEGNHTESFNFKAQITGETGNNGTQGVEISVPLKYLKQFLRNC